MDIGDGYSPQKGDIMILGASGASEHGHMAVFTGRQWVSAFKQNSMFVYRQCDPFTVYRW